MRDLEKKFEGKDRRLYYNKAVCELQMGRYDLCIITVNTYLKHIKEQYKLIHENPLKIDSKKIKQKIALLPST